MADNLGALLGLESDFSLRLLLARPRIHYMREADIMERWSILTRQCGF